MTLKEFAEEQGIAESTARSWKLRGKIYRSEDGGWEFANPAQRNATLATPECNAGATLYGATGVAGKGWRVPTLMRPSLTPEEEALRTAKNLAGLPNSIPLPGLVDVTVGADFGDSSGAAGKVAGVERDSVTGQITKITVASQWEDVAQPDSVTTVAGTRHWCGKPECEKCGPVIRDLTAPIEFPYHFRPPLTDSAQDSRLCRREDSAGGVGDPESHRESCAGCSDLQHQIDSLRTMVHALATENQGFRVRIPVLEASNEKLKKDARTLYEDSAGDLKRFEALETEVAFLRTRLGQPDPPLVLGTTSRGPIDPPGPNWGA